jgi:hypothetical protein
MHNKKTKAEIAEAILTIRSMLMTVLEEETTDLSIMQSLLLGRELCKAMKGLGEAHHQLTKDLY